MAPDVSSGSNLITLPPDVLGCIVHLLDALSCCRLRRVSWDFALLIDHGGFWGEFHHQFWGHRDLAPGASDFFASFRLRFVALCNAPPLLINWHEAAQAVADDFPLPGSSHCLNMARAYTDEALAAICLITSDCEMPPSSIQQMFIQHTEFPTMERLVKLEAWDHFQWLYRKTKHFAKWRRWAAEGQSLEQGAVLINELIHPHVPSGEVSCALDVLAEMFKQHVPLRTFDEDAFLLDFQSFMKSIKVKIKTKARELQVSHCLIHTAVQTLVASPACFAIIAVLVAKRLGFRLSVACRKAWDQPELFLLDEVSEAGDRSYLSLQDRRLSCTDDWDDTFECLPEAGLLCLLLEELASSQAGRDATDVIQGNIMDCQSQLLFLATLTGIGAGLSQWLDNVTRFCWTGCYENTFPRYLEHFNERRHAKAQEAVDEVAQAQLP